MENGPQEKMIMFQDTCKGVLQQARDTLVGMAGAAPPIYTLKDVWFQYTCGLQCMAKFIYISLMSLCVLCERLRMFS